MNLTDKFGGVVSTDSFSHFSFHEDSVHLHGDREYTLTGERLYFLVPFLTTEQFPEELLKPKAERILEDIVRSPFHVSITDVSTTGPSYFRARSPLGFPLPFRVACSPLISAYQWLSVEADDGTAIHPYSDFRFITPTGFRSEWHLVFGRQAYELSFESDHDRDQLGPDLIARFPNPEGPRSDPKKWINCFSVHPTSNKLPARFFCPQIRRIEMREVDTTNLAEMDGPLVASTDFDLGHSGPDIEIG